MPNVVIENPILNSPYEEPTRHFRFDDDGITDEIVESRRVSSYFIPIPAAKKKGKQLAFDTEWTRERVKENTFINQVRARVSQWRTGGHVGVSTTTRNLLEYWIRPDRERIPYTLNGEERSYYPDFIARICRHGGDEEINLIVEVTGEKKKDKEAKAAIARTLWVPAVNNNGGFGRWVFVEIRDPWNTQKVTREILTAVSAGGRNVGEEATA
jgi:hypothetical protein